MADVFDKEKRSEVMARVRSKDTAPELIVRRFLHRKGLRYRLHARELPGCPDLVFPRKRIVLFVNGCFWHGHRGCRKAKLPSTRPQFWSEKIASNIARDERNYEELKRQGWRVFVVWECEINEESLNSLASAIREGSTE